MFIVLIQRFIARDRFWLSNGFYLTVGWYGLQRFVWEFFKPYGPLVGPFTLFHFLSAAVLIYAIAMIATAPKQQGSPKDERAFA
jgi:prolipoprotein diacylglyceryltransferase